MQTQTETTTVEKILFSKRDTAAALSVSKRKVDYLIAAKVLGATRIGRRTLIHRFTDVRSKNWRGRVRDGAQMSALPKPVSAGMPGAQNHVLDFDEARQRKRLLTYVPKPVVFDRRV